MKGFMKNTRYPWLTVLIEPKPDKRRADTLAANEKSSPAVTKEQPKASKQLDDAQFDDLRRRDWYLVRQINLGLGLSSRP
jgi:hypothetical protein